jgi:hypothetical protein
MEPGSTAARKSVRAGALPPHGRRSDVFKHQVNPTESRKGQTMHSLFQIVIRCAVIVSVASAALAQDKRESDAPRATITAVASTERVRFTAPSSVVQMHLEVYSEAALKLFDFELKGGNVLDWHLQNGQAERVAAGAYLCVVTVKNLAGKITQQIGTITIAEQQVTVEPGRAAALNAQQAQAIGPLEADASLTVLKAGEAVNGIVLAHNGEEAQISRGQGPLTFRIGDFFSGKDSEQMRLTHDGKLGIGVADPQAKLDVAGAIRTSEGIVFPDGTMQTTAYVASGRSLSARSRSLRDAQGRSVVEQDKPGSAEQEARLAPEGTFNRLAKFANDGVSLVDSAIIDVGGNVGIGVANPQSSLDYRGSLAPFFTRDIGTTNFGTAQSALQLGVTNTGSRNVNVGPSFLFFADNTAGAKSFLGRVSGVWENPTAGAEAGAILFQVRSGSGDTGASTERMRITAAGNVGIGTSTPTRLLDVNGGGRFAPGGSGGDVVFGTPNTETGMTISNVSGRADVRFNGSILKLVAGPTGGPPSDFNGLAITTAGNVGIGTTSPSAFKLLVDGGSGGGVSGYSPNSTGVAGSSTNGAGVDGSSTNGTGVFGHSSFGNGVLGTSSSGIGVSGSSDSNVGVSGSSDTSYGTRGTSNSSYGVYGASGSNVGVYGYSNSNYGVYGYSVSSYAGYFGGDVHVLGTLTQNSDARLKQRVLNLAYGLPEVLRLRPVSWHWKDRPERGPQLGLIAQEVEALLPELVTTDQAAEQTKGLNYLGLLPVIIKAIQEQQTAIEQKEAALKSLKADLDARLQVVEQMLRELQGQRTPAQAKPQPEQP